ncbi:PEP-CTERM sorting domain-containing protein, partial [Candidatus Omnitrophota bacterium]
TEASDAAEGEIIFFDGTPAEIGSGASGALNSSDWALESNIDSIPVGTRSIEVAVVGDLYSGTYVNAFFDDAYFKIGEEVIPEPATMSLLGMSLLGLFGIRRKRS